MPTAFFVYGTLLRGECNHPVLARHGLAQVRPARARGRLFDTGAGYPAMRAAPPGAAGAAWEVRGELVVPVRFASALADLDALEEFHGPGDPRNLYERREVEVDLGDGATTCAWTYLYAGLASLTPIPGGDWRRHTGRIGP